MQYRLDILQKNNPNDRTILQYKWIPYNLISPHLKRAVIAAEDTSTGLFGNVKKDGDQLLVKAEITAANTTLEGKRFISLTGLRAHVSGLETDEIVIENPVASSMPLQA